MLVTLFFVEVYLRVPILRTVFYFVSVFYFTGFSDRGDSIECKCVPKLFSFSFISYDSRCDSCVSFERTFLLHRSPRLNFT